jgi:microcystin-dependent protein
MYLGRVILFGGDYCPQGTLEARGTLLPIVQYQALYALLGTTYGGDGQTNFALPDLRGRTPNALGQGPGLSTYALGQTGGTESVTLTVLQTPAHTHIGTLRAVGNAPASTGDPANAAPARAPAGAPVYQQDAAPNVAMNPGTVTLAPAGDGQPFSNLGPYLTLRYCIVTEGYFPTP